MPVEHWINRVKRISVAEFSGRCTLLDIQAYHFGLLSDPEWSRDLRRLADFSGVTDFDVSPNDLQKLVKSVRQLTEEFSKARVAVVAPQNIIFGMGRMFQMMSEDLNHPYQIFRTKEAALDWLVGSTWLDDHGGLASVQAASEKRAFSPL